jgi:hypothetical protein
MAGVIACVTDLQGFTFVLPTRHRDMEPLLHSTTCRLLPRCNEASGWRCLLRCPDPMSCRPQLWRVTASSCGALALGSRWQEMHSGCSRAAVFMFLRLKVAAAFSWRSTTLYAFSWWFLSQGLLGSGWGRPA